MHLKWTRLVRFISSDGRIYYGDAILNSGSTDVRESSYARLIRGDPMGSYTFGAVRPIMTLLSPLRYGQVPTVRLLGLNYRKHAEESNLDLPKYPVVFNKPATAVAGPIDNIPVGSMAAEEGAIDYEAELVVVIGHQCRNVVAADALKFVAGYTVGNDVSQREWQIKRGGGQWNLGKMFDGWAPIGPAIIAARHLDNPGDLKIKAWVNGELRQSSNTSHMLFGVAQVIEFLSRGTTLMPGDLIFMGTPEGVGMGFKPPKYLKDGDVVDCWIQGIGSIHNKVVRVDDSNLVTKAPTAAVRQEPRRRKTRPAKI